MGQLPGANLFLPVERTGNSPLVGDMHSSDQALLRLIAVFKFGKAALLVAAGIGILKMVHMNPAAVLNHWVANMGFDPGQRFVSHTIQKVTNIPPHRIRELGIATFPYAALFATEGIGLWLLKRWAEWFTVIATGSLIPIEVYEIVSHPSVLKVLVLIVNIGIVAYLIYRIRREPAR
jgi:uncharacterized membrane protein (DUF2068 family)